MLVWGLTSNRSLYFTQKKADAPACWQVYYATCVKDIFAVSHGQRWLMCELFTMINATSAVLHWELCLWLGLAMQTNICLLKFGSGNMYRGRNLSIFGLLHPCEEPWFPDNLLYYKKPNVASSSSVEIWVRTNAWQYTAIQSPLSSVSASDPL